jgi:hypothetical protein
MSGASSGPRTEYLMHPGGRLPSRLAFPHIAFAHAGYLLLVLDGEQIEAADKGSSDNVFLCGRRGRRGKALSGASSNP